MEQHPVPQNITTFQFRLIGDMTIKQFGYLGGGIALAFIAYKLPLPFIFTWPLAAIFALAGFGFAFVPIEERPMDTWFFSFLRNVYNPTVFHWERSAPTPEPSTTTLPPPAKIPTLSLGVFPTLPIPGMKKTTQPSTPQKQETPPAPSPKLATFVGTPPQVAMSKKSITPSPMDTFFTWIDNLFVPSQKPKPAIIATQSPPMPQPAVLRPAATVMKPSPAPRVPLAYTKQPPPPPSVTGKHMPPPTSTPTQHQKNEPPAPIKDSATSKELQGLKEQLGSLQKELQNKTIEESRILELQKQFTELLSQRDKMEKELTRLQQEAKTKSEPPQTYRQAGIVDTNKPKEPTVKMMPKDVATRAGLPRLTTFPNVVTGIIKDYDNTLLPGVLVTVKDKDGIPLRALKTNKLGQFAASTPLGNGTYVVEVEDPRGRFSFDKVQITLNGAVMPALQIIAKSKRELDREALSRQIFGTPNASS